MKIIACEELFFKSVQPMLEQEFADWKIEVLNEEFLSSPNKELVQILICHSLTERLLFSFPNLAWAHTELPCDRSLLLPPFVTCSLSSLYKELHSDLMWTAALALAKQVDFLIKKQKIESVPWDLSKKIFLQIGLSEVGVELCKQAKKSGCSTWGIDSYGSFHKFCDKTYKHEHLHSLIPAADIVSISSSMAHEPRLSLSSNALSLCKPGSILLLSENGQKDFPLDCIPWEKLRSVVYGNQEQESTSLQSIPNCIQVPLELCTKEQAPSKRLAKLIKKNFLLFMKGKGKKMTGLFSMKE